MSQSLARLIGHLIFSTKNRARLLWPDIRPELYAYMAGILKEAGSTPILIGGTDDHVHVLCGLSKNVAPCRIIQELKESSSKWLKPRHPQLRGFHWQNGYGAFSIGESGIAAAKRYIASQEEHHRQVSFQEEYRAFLKKYRISYDERYVWD
jgi:REP element-mobilizing transposase RayT